MSRGLFSAVSGLRVHQVAIDVIGNNIANLNTPGFKTSRITFQDVLSQSLGNGMQVGLGVTVGAVGTDYASGDLQFTGRSTDLAIDGPGFFVLGGTRGQTLTRVGSFDWDATGYLIHPSSGQRVQGWLADANGGFGVRDASTLVDVKISTTAASLAEPTDRIVLGRNLHAGTLVGDPDGVYTTSAMVYDSLGRQQSVALRFTKAADNQWDVEFDDSGVWTALTTLNFNNDGSVVTPASGTINLAFAGADPLTITADFNQLTQSYSPSTGSDVAVTEINGRPFGNLVSVDVDGNGRVIGRYSNGVEQSLAQVALATVPNPGGLQKVGATSYMATEAAGTMEVGTPGGGGRSHVSPGSLELSNVDLPDQITELIVTQRGFQANTRVLTAADEMLQDVVNLRR